MFASRLAAVVLFVLATLCPALRGPYAFDAGTLAHARYFPSSVDNFNVTDTRKWQQAYFVNSTFYDASADKQIVFLYVGGEGPLSAPTSNFVLDFLPATKAVFFALEHRYYGCHNSSSCPYTKPTADASHLQYLSSRQALADLSAFHSYVTNSEQYKGQ